MSVMTDQDRAELLDSLLQVAVCCPVEHDNPVDCPLHRVRKMDLIDRIHWFCSLTDDDLRYLTSYHTICMTNKLDSREESPDRFVPPVRTQHLSPETGC